MFVSSEDRPTLSSVSLTLVYRLSISCQALTHNRSESDSKREGLGQFTRSTGPRIHPWDRLDRATARKTRDSFWKLDSTPCGVHESQVEQGFEHVALSLLKPGFTFDINLSPKKSTSEYISRTMSWSFPGNRRSSFIHGLLSAPLSSELLIKSLGSALHFLSQASWSLGGALQSQQHHVWQRGC